MAGDASATLRVVAYVPDLLDRSKVAAIGNVTFVREPTELAGTDADVVVVDLMRDGVIEALPALAGRRVVAFGRHTAIERLDAARAAGAQVMPRSAFFADIAAAVGVDARS